MNENVYWHTPEVSHKQRKEAFNQNGLVVWFTGLSGSGKSSLAHATEKVLFERDYRTVVLDGDNVRHGLCSDLGFSAHDRHENIRRVGEVSKLFKDAGIIVFTAFISPFISDRLKVREIVGSDNFVEIYCEASVAQCEERDTKGLYKKARLGEVKDFTGISSPYEPPVHPDLVLHTHKDSLENCVSQIILLLEKKYKLADVV